MTVTPLAGTFAGLVVAGAAFLAGWIAHRRVGEGKMFSAEQLSAKMIREAERESENLKKSALLEAKDEWFREKAKLDREIQAQKTEALAQERKLQEQETSLNRRAEVLDKKDRDQKRVEREHELKAATLEERERELGRVLAEQNTRLQRISGMTAEE